MLLELSKILQDFLAWMVVLSIGHRREKIHGVEG